MYKDKIMAVKARRKINSIINEVAGIRTSNRRHQEHDIQVSCFKWLKYAIPDLYRVTFAVPNGGLRDELTALSLNAEGLKKGVSDIIVLKSNNKYGSLCIEMKTRSGKQTKEQKQWEKDCKLIGGAQYVVCRSLNDFKNAIIEYCLDMCYDGMINNARIIACARNEKKKMENGSNEEQDKKVQEVLAST